MSKKTITLDNLPRKYPTLATVVYYLLLDKINAPGWVWGVYLTIFAIVWISAIYRICTDEKIDVLEDQ